MELVTLDGKKLNPQCSTLVVPALSIGNVGQLTVDLLISSTRAERVGYLDDPAVVPCVGNNAYLPTPKGDLALPLEIYESESNAMALIQKRSPVIKGMMIQFAKHLADFAAENGKNHVVVLSSLEAGRRKMIDASGKMQMHYLSSKDIDGVDEDCEKLGWKRLLEYDPSHRRWEYLNSLAEGHISHADILEDDLDDENYYAALPFAAIFACCKAKGIKVTCILCYCSEGDNIPDSFQVAEAACQLLGLSPNAMLNGNPNGGRNIPFSWNSVYGPPPDVSIF